MIERSRETPAEHRSGEPVETKLLRIAARAREEPKLKFVNLYHLMNEELLLGCYRRLSENKAAGIDEVTKTEYGENLEANIRELVGRLQGWRTGRNQCGGCTSRSLEATNEDH